MTTPAVTTPDSIVFVDAHAPAMEAGGYVITLTQQVTRLQSAPLVQRARVHVLGPRVALEPSWIESRFPQPSVDDQDEGVLPHVVLTRSTLPWERGAVRGPAEGSFPWLAVLLFTEQEIVGDAGLPAVGEDQVNAGSLRALSPAPAFPGLGHDEPGQADGDLVRVVDVPRGLLAGLLPEASWLHTLTHVRERFVCAAPAAVGAELDDAKLDSARDLLAGHGHVLGPEARVQVEVPDAQWRIDGDTTLYVEREPDGSLAITDEARAVVLGCRVTVPGRRYRAYLVSLDGRYVDSSRPLSTGPVFDFGDANGDADLVRLVVLDRWEFTVAKDAGRLAHLLSGLAGRTGTPGPALGLPVPTTPRMSGLGVDLLHAGYALLPHRLRNGGNVRSWYRGPLVARREEPPLPPAPHEVADALLLVDQATGMLLTSYAAAWELGRTLTTGDPAVALDLVRWKAERRRHAHRLRSAAEHPHVTAPPGEAPTLPSTVLSWLQRLLVLDGVPFGYLVPDPAMVPRESMRVFQLDRAWLACLVDGAFSAGRLLTADTDTERALLDDAMADASAHLAPVAARPTVSGCLIRSDVVSGWPALQVDGRSGEALLPVLRRARLSDNVLLVLFRGDVDRIDVHPNPEALHHGLVRDAASGWRIAGWTLKGFPELAVGVPAPMRRGTLGDRNVLDVAVARQRPDGHGAFTSEKFALRMVGGVPLLRVQVTSET